MWSAPRIHSWPIIISCMNDITLASDTLQYILFADDTSIFLSGNNLQRLVANINIELEKNCPMAECKQINLKYQ